MKGILGYGAYFARAIECSLIAHAMDEWVMQLEWVNLFVYRTKYPLSSGMGLTEAPRGALGHWHQINTQELVFTMP